MALPVSPLPQDTVEVGGVSVPIRSMSRAQAVQLQQFQGREDEAEDFILSSGCGVSVEDARAWRGTVDLRTAGVLIDAILVLSGLATVGGDGNPKAVSSKGRSSAR